MHNPYFQFQQFTVWHDHCAMKVCTDGVLLGSWCTVEPAQTVLDVGTGSGVIALMLAQRNATANILGIDIDADSVEQAQQNFLQSPFSQRLQAKCQDFNHHELPAASYDLIVSNPPFFTEDTLAPRPQRANARSTCSLPFAMLLAHSAMLLNEQGRLAVVIPHSSAADFILTASMHGLHLHRRCDVRTTQRKTSKRTLLEFGKQSTSSVFTTLTIHGEKGGYTDEYIALTRDFYLQQTMLIAAGLT